MSDNYKDLDPAELDQLADSLDALVTEFAGRARYLRTLSLRHRVAGRRLRAESAIGSAEKMIADGYVGVDLRMPVCPTCSLYAGDYIRHVGACNDWKV